MKQRLFHSKVFWASLLGIVFVLLLLGLGKILDTHSEGILSNVYLKDNQGIIEGSEPIEVRRGGKEAFIFIHGFMASPKGFEESIEFLKDKLLQTDFYAPLLPYHGRGLRKSKHFNNKAIESYARDFIKEKAKHYTKVYVVGSSYAGAILSHLLLEKGFSKNIVPILMAPALYLKKNTSENRFKLALLSPFRNYCSAKFLGCGRKPESVDRVGYQQEVEVSDLGNVVVPAVKELFTYQVHNQNNLRKIRRDYWIVMTPDDNQVAYDKVKRDCDQNKKCHLKTIPSGKHKFMWGIHKQDYWQFLIQLTQQEEVL